MESAFGIATGAYADERSDWSAAIARAAREGWRFVELTAIGDSRVEDLAAVEPGLFAAFERVSLHAPVAGDPDDAIAAIADVGLAVDVVLHPDVYGAAPAAATLGPLAVFENMDVAKQFGQTVEDLDGIFERFPEAGFCLDVAHVWTNDGTLALGHALLDAYGDRLRQLHVSGIEPDGSHRETTAADLELYRPLLDRCPHVPWLLEAELSAT
jgi:hypothetical protein